MLQGWSREMPRGFRLSLASSLWIALTRYTTAYLFFTLVTCLVLCALQGVLLYDNPQAANILTDVVDEAQVPPHIAMVMSDHLQVKLKEGLLSSDDAFASGERRQVVEEEEDESASSDEGEVSSDDEGGVSSSDEEGAESDDEGVDEDDEAASTSPVVTSTITTATTTGTSLAAATATSPPVSIPRPLDDINLSGGSTGVVSLPLSCIYSLSWLEENLHDAQREDVATSFFQLWLFTIGLVAVYARATFSRVGASPIIHRMYKLVLFFSVGLHLASFFTLVSATLWIAKIVRGSYAVFAEHRTLYLIGFVVVLVAEIPWLFYGWICVRKECKIRFGVFLFLSAVLIAISSVLFSSNLYRCIFTSWSFFATVTVTAFVLLVLTAAMGVLCYFNYGKGLAHYLKVTDALEGSDFTPVYFPRGDHDEKGGLGESQLMSKYYETDIKIDIVNDDIERNSTEKKQSQPPVSFSFATLRVNDGIGKKRGSSIYSNKTEGPIILSASPPLLSDLSSLTTYARTIKRLTKANGRKSKDQASLTEESSLGSPTASYEGSTEEGRPPLRVVNATPRQSTVLVKKPPRAAGTGIKPLMTAGAADAQTARIPSLNSVSTFRPFSGSASTASPGSARASSAGSLKSRVENRGGWGTKAPIEELPSIPTKF
ncbi:hypothetical protein H1R20_g5009, partial [Candolleomyces eurysporus]